MKDRAICRGKIGVWKGTNGGKAGGGGGVSKGESSEIEQGIAMVIMVHLVDTANALTRSLRKLLEAIVERTK